MTLNRPHGTNGKHYEVSARLRRAWVPFFSRYGKLLPVQVQTIPPILGGRNVVVCSATASGKTEAVVAPTAERCLAERWTGMSVLYIIPTRALANDTLVRIEGPLNDMGISVALKHGDKPRFDPVKPPDWLITTPESLDSILCRHTRALVDIRTVILDELHLIDGTYRGDQLRVLLRRLQADCGGRHVSVCALSATLANPYDVALRYMQDACLVSVPGARELEYTFVRLPQEVLPLARSRGWRKVLFFCNSRQSVEETAESIAGQWAPYPVVAHHGSLDRRLREEAERVMQESRVAVCVSTSTLEVGIDIGDIDLIVLVELPHSVSTLLQRIGRGNRRTNIVHAVLISQSDEMSIQATAMLEAAKAGSITPVDYVPDPSVAVQQTFSLLFQHPEGMHTDTLLDLTSPLVSQEDSLRILNHLRERDWIDKERERWYASTKVMDLGERGKVHSNIPDAAQYTVVDATSGKAVGKIGGLFDKGFVLGRRAWEVVSVRRDTIVARPLRGTPPAALFRPHRQQGAYAQFLPPDLR